MLPLHYQLYSSRNRGPIRGTLGALATVGYRAVEGYGSLYGTSDHVDTLARGLEAAGLRMPSGHFALEALEGRGTDVIDAASRLGMRYLVCPFVAPGERPETITGWHAFGERLEALVPIYRSANLSLCWHNHDFEFQPLSDGTLPIEHLFNGAPSLKWQIDVAWVARAGADPLRWIARLGERIELAHIKDIAPSGEALPEDGWADIGHGILDWRALVPALVEVGCTTFIAEHDNPEDDKRFAKWSIEAWSSIWREFE